MSEAPGRSESEKQIIENLAYRLSEHRGHPFAQQTELWLEAEAILEAEGKITQLPIELPFDVSFRANNIQLTTQEFDIDCPVPFVTAGVNIRDLTQFFAANVALKMKGEATPQLALRPTMLVHDSRATLVQMVMIAITFDRIARLIDWSAQPAFPQSKFLAQVNAVDDPALSQEYLISLLRAGPGDTRLADIDQAIANIKVAQYAGFDLTELYLGSPMKGKGRCKTSNRKAALFGFGLLSGMAGAFVEGAVHGAGDAIGEWSTNAIIEHVSPAPADVRHGYDRKMKQLDRVHRQEPPVIPV